MSRIAFDQLPDPARLWVFAADRPLTTGERDALAGAVEAGLAAWNAHGSPVRWGWRIAHEQFLLIGVDETETALSGCSIDSAVHAIRALESRLGVSFLDNARIFYRGEAGVARATRPEFRELARSGAVDAETVVFNNVLETVGEFRRGLWEVPLRESWHAQAFPVEAK